MKQRLLGYGNVQSGVERVHGHLSIVAVENAKHPVRLVQVRPLHLVRFIKIVLLGSHGQQSFQLHDGVSESSERSKITRSEESGGRGTIDGRTSKRHREG